ncbi:Arc family DNA-binding protein, partial [Klebsiella pneumoniae]
MARSSDVEYKMRMTQELKEKILESAKLNSRSMNADIVARLEKS